MKLVVFGLTVSSSWGNGHATLWRGLCRALARRGHTVVFFERDVPYYRSARDLFALEAGRLVFYESWDSVREEAEAELADADVAMVTSYCPDGVAATDLVAASRSLRRIFYDLDTPVTLASIASGEPPAYIGERGLTDFDLVLSFTGGRALSLLQERLGARRVAPLYGHVDPQVHHAPTPSERYRGDLSYLATYSADRAAAVDELFVRPALAAPKLRFVLGGAMYPEPEAFPENLVHHPHVPPGEHAEFFCSSRLTLNVTRKTMAELGFCPSGRLFEAAACGIPIVSDWFAGLDLFFEPDSEILVARDRHDVLAALSLPAEELVQIGQRARARVLTEHTAHHRALTLESLLADPEAVAAPRSMRVASDPLGAGR